MHPHLDLIDQLIRMFGWPALLGGFVWAIRKWDKASETVIAVQADTKIVKSEIEEMKNNHLAHLQVGITQVAASNDKAVDILHAINSGIQVLIDRSTRL